MYKLIHLLQYNITNILAMESTKYRIDSTNALYVSNIKYELLCVSESTCEDTNINMGNTYLRQDERCKRMLREGMHTRHKIL